MNAFLRPLLLLGCLWFLILSLGLFLLVINAALLMLTAKLVDGFTVVTTHLGAPAPSPTRPPMPG